MSDASFIVEQDPTSTQTISRRDFLKLGGAAAATWAFLDGPALFQLVTESGVKIPEGPNNPFDKVTAEFFMTPHVGPRDYLPLTDEIPSCDLFIPEWEAWTPENKAFVAQFNAGQVTRDQIPAGVQGDPRFVDMFTLCFDNHKPVAIIDIPKGSQLAEGLAQLKTMSNLDFSKDFDQAVHLYDTYLQTMATWQRDRENYMLSQLPQVIADYRAAHPEKNGKEIKLIIELGSNHTRVEHLVAHQKAGAEDVPVTAKYPMSQFSYEFTNPADRPKWYTDPETGKIVEPKKEVYRWWYQDEAERRYWFRDAPENAGRFPAIKKPDTDLLAHAMLEHMAESWFLWPNTGSFPTTAEAMTWYRNIVSKFTLDDIRGLWQKQLSMRTGNTALSNSALPSDFQSVVSDEFAKRGMPDSFIHSTVTF